MKIGLVMEGGAMRGMFTAGVIDVFMENGITFDGAIGVSAGATFGCNIKSGQVGRALRYNCKYCNDSRYGSFKNFLKTGDAFDIEFCYHELVNKLDVWDSEAFAKNPMEFWCVAADVEAGEARYHKMTDGKEHDIEWIRASASVFLFSTSKAKSKLSFGTYVALISSNTTISHSNECARSFISKTLPLPT